MSFALNEDVNVFEAGKIGALGTSVSTTKVLVAAGAGAKLPAVSVAVSVNTEIVMVLLPVKPDSVTVRVTVPLVSVPLISKFAFAVPVLMREMLELERVTSVTPP